jgi:hypothetical protein
MFELENPVEKKFGSFDETLSFVSEGKKRLVRIPISGLWKKGARFYGDGLFGSGSNIYKTDPLANRSVQCLHMPAAFHLQPTISSLRMPRAQPG